MVDVGRTSEQQLLLGEWACLGILYPAPIHGFAIAAQLKPNGHVGRVWSLSRALTYRSLEQLAIRGYIQPVGEEPGIAGGNRTILRATPTGRAELRKWLLSPAVHLRDLRSELLLKLIVAEHCGINVRTMLQRQRDHIAEMAEALATASDDPSTLDPAALDPAALDVVALWRDESSRAALRFLDRVLESVP